MPPNSKTLPWLRNSLKIETDECILWPFLRDHKGYGKVRYNGRMVMVSRLVLFLTTDFNFDSVLLARHTCDNPPCCNKRHIISGTAAQNAQDAIARFRRHQMICKHGHALTGDNVYEHNGERYCRKCRKAYRILYRAQIEKRLDH
jgi:hypothetical protein